MLARHTNSDKKVRSAILTLKTHANALFEQGLDEKFKFPILRSTMAFNSALSKSLHDAYSSGRQGIDVMEAEAPYIAFESWREQGLVLEVAMQERMLAAHVSSVLKQLPCGYQETKGTKAEALASNFQSLSYRLKLYGSNL